MSGPLVNTFPVSTTKVVTPFRAGRDLVPGTYVRNIASGGGVITDTGGDYLLVTDQTDKKGNRLLTNTSTGESVYATPGSIWML